MGILSTRRSFKFLVEVTPRDASHPFHRSFSSSLILRVSSSSQGKHHLIHSQAIDGTSHSCAPIGLYRIAGTRPKTVHRSFALVAIPLPHSSTLSYPRHAFFRSGETLPVMSAGPSRISLAALVRVPSLPRLQLSHYLPVLRGRATLMMG